jgi:virginiamycin B lyase
MARSNRLRCGSGQRRSQPFVEGLESRRLMAVTFTAYPISPNAIPTSITVGPDDNLWFTVPADGAIGNEQTAEIGEISPTTGVVNYFPTPDEVDYPAPSSIVSGPGNFVWYLDPSSSSSLPTSISSFNVTTHVFARYAAGSLPVDLALGSDGNLWFTDQGTSSIGMFNPTTHAVTEYPLPNNTDAPTRITPGPNGDLFFITRVGVAGTFAVGEINPTTHAITLTDVPEAADGVPFSITAGSDGNIWMGEHAGTFSTGLISFNPTTLALTSYAVNQQGGITSGPDGNIWYDVDLGEFNLTTHVASSYPVPGGPGGENSFRGLRTIVTGPDGNVWLTTDGYIFSAHIIPATQSAVAGYVYQDPTGSGPPSPSDVAGPLDNVTVFLDLRGDGQLDPGDPVVNTDALGYYAFTGLTPGTYTVRLVPYPGNIATYPNNSTQTVTVTGGSLGSPSQLGLLPTTSLLPLTYDPTPFGTHNPDVQTAEVNGLYNLILHRAPDPTGGASAVAYLKNNGSLGQLAADLLTSAEYETGVIASYYQNYLRRTGSSAEIAAWVNLMQNGLTEEQVAADFLTSAEYSLLFPANATFVQALYGDVLGRLPAGSEVAAWVNLLDQGVTRSQVISAFINTHESDIRSVEGLYGIIFARGVESNAQSSAVAALQSGVTLVQLATGLFGSAEFTARANATVG